LEVYVPRSEKHTKENERKQELKRILTFFYDKKLMSCRIISVTAFLELSCNLQQDMGRGRVQAEL
jgi:mannose/fructose/N-acetylgalactosamine-specific phosphotransferase system component IID